MSRDYIANLSTKITGFYYSRSGENTPSATTGKTIKNMLQEMKDIEIVEPIITIKSTMKNETIEQMEKFADYYIGGEASEI